jgi:hypothetical protein
MAPTVISTTRNDKKSRTVNVLFTIAVLAAVGMWAMMIYNRLHRLRRQILSEWKKLDAREKAGEPAIDGARYNELAAAYNAALEAFPDNVIAGLAGFRPAQKFVSNKP